MIYLLDGNQEVIKIVRSSAVISAIQTQELPEDNSLLRDYLSVRLKNDERLFNAQYMAVKSYGGNRNAFDLYRIASEMVPDNATEFVGVQVAPYELEGVVIEDLRPQNRPLNQTMNQVLEGSDWRLGYISDNLPNVTTNFYYVSVKDALKKIQELLNIEMLFKVEISGNKITDKWIEVYHQLGNRTMKRFNYGTNALSVVRESSHDELYTALIGRGKGEEVGETESGDSTYGRKINFADVEWKKSAGNPVDKPKGQKYIELPNATAEYGIKLLDGRKVPRIGIVEFSDTDDPEKLIQETYQELLVRARPKVLFKASVINTGDMLIGDTVTIHRHDLGFHYQARVRKVVRDRKNNNQTQVEIGDVVHTPSTKRQGQINSALNNVASDLENVRGEITEARQSADGKNTNFYGNVEPERKKVGDTWFRDHPSLTGESQILVWNGEAWELIMDTSETTKNADAIAEQQQEIDDARQVADEALSEIDQAIANAGFSSLTDLTASLDGRTTALTANVDSITGIVTDHQGRISTVEQLATGLQTTVASKASQSQVTQLANGLQSVVKDLDDLEVGGRNLIVFSEMENGSFNYFTGNNIGSSENQARTKELIKISPNSSYYLWTDMKTLEGAVQGVEIAYTLFDKNKEPIEGYGEFATEKIIKVTEDAEYIRVRFGGSGTVPWDEHTRFLLTRSTIPTDWTPAPEDMAAQSQITQLQDNINLRVTKGELLSQINIEADRMLFQSDKILLDADNVILSGTAWMDGAVIADASIDGAKIADATIGSAKIANLDVGKISGNTTEFISSKWNTAVGGNVRINGTGIQTVASNNEGLSIEYGGLFLYNRTGNVVGSLETGYTGYGSTGDETGLNLFIRERHHFAISKYRTTPAGTAQDLISIQDAANSVDFYLNLDMKNNQVVNVNRINLRGVAQGLTMDNSNRPMLAGEGVFLSYGNTSSSSARLFAGDTVVRVYRQLDLDSNNIINQSDGRLKRDIKDTEINSLNAIKSWKIVGFNWKDNEKNTRLGRQMGLIAQDTPDLATYDAQSDTWSINSSKQIMMNTHAIQQLAYKQETIETTVTGHTDTIHQLQQELSKANRRIEELEGVI